MICVASNNVCKDNIKNCITLNGLIIVGFGTLKNTLRFWTALDVMPRGYLSRLSQCANGNGEEGKKGKFEIHALSC